MDARRSPKSGSPRERRRALSDKDLGRSSIKRIYPTTPHTSVRVPSSEADLYSVRGASPVVDGSLMRKRHVHSSVVLLRKQRQANGRRRRGFAPRNYERILYDHRFNDVDRDRTLLCYIKLIARTCDVTSSRNSYRDLHDGPLSLSPRSANRERDRGD